MNVRRWIVVAVALIASTFASPAGAQQLDVIRGRIIGPDTIPLAGVNVKVTTYTGGVNKTTRTDRNGRFTVTFPNGEGDYWIELTAIGFLPKRYQIKRIADEEILLADNRMASNVATLDPVTISSTGARAIVPRTGVNADVSGTERTLTNTAVSGDLAGNLAAMAATIPGIQLIPGMDGASDMFSALGLSPDQNSTTFEGLGSSLSALPRDAQVSASIRPISYDPSIGNFSGAQISLSSLPGSNYSRRNVSALTLTPETEWTTEAAEDLGAKNTLLSFSGGFAGPIKMDRHFYNGSYQLDRRYSDLQTLLNTSPLGLSAAGVSADSVTRLLDLLRASSIPAAVSGNVQRQARDEVRLQGNLDMTPQTASGSGHSFNLSAGANYSRNAPVGSNLIRTVPSFSGETDNWSGNAALRHINYFGFGILSRTTVGASVRGTGNQPYLRLPSGNVRVNSTLEDGRSSIQNLSFGGNPQGTQTEDNYAFEVLNQMTWYSANNKHTLKLTSNLRQETYSNDRTNNRLGSFSFNSLAALEAGQPSSFSRTLYAAKQEGSQLTGSVSLGDFWRPKPNVQFQYGLRLDGNRFLSLPEYNRAVEETFGLRNDHVPNRVYASPRFGFTWTYGKANQIAFIPGAARPPLALVRGGIGIFQNLRDASMIQPMVNSTGLPSSTQQISCVGSAAPSPHWQEYFLNPSAIPTECADGSSGSVFATGAPTVNLFDRGYRQTRSLRSSLDWAGAILDNRFAAGVSATYSRNLNQPGSVDINFVPQVRFALADEAGRPVFAEPSAIVPTTGAIASRNTRFIQDFNRVTVQKSDLRSETRQLFFSLKPVISGSHYNWDVGYTLQDIHELYRGFSSTAYNPLDLHWDRGLNSRHVFNYSLFYNAFDVVRLQWSGTFRSGAPFTPVVSGDINGDGSFGNDRAFVFDPMTAADPALSSAMSELLTHGAPAARKCLNAQVGQLASRGSCRGPWMATGTLNVRFNQQKIGLPQRLSVSLSFTNPLLLADLLVNGEDNLRGWGQSIQPEQALLFVRGFDPATQRYKYEVNQRFGSTRPTQTASRALSYVSINFGYNIGVPRERQQLTQRLDMGRGRPGTKATAATLKTTGSSTIPNPMAMILQQPDSLKLNRRQADSLASLSRAYTQFADSVWTPVARQLEAMPAGYDRGDAYELYREAREKTVDRLLTIVPHVKNLLTPAQRRMLPPQILNFLDDRVLRSIRSTTAIGG